MKLKRLLALALALCMALSLAVSNGVAFAEEPSNVVVDDLIVEELDGSQVNVDTTEDIVAVSEESLALDLDPEEPVKVLIIMEEDSVVESDSNAELNSETEAQMAELAQEQEEVVAEIEQTVLDGEQLDVSYSYTWLLNGVAAEVPYGALVDIAKVNGVKQVLVQRVYEVCDTEVEAVAAPMTTGDGAMIGRENVWDVGYTGMGMKIAIVDTGLDLDHPNFAALSEDKLTDTSATADSVVAVLESLHASSRLSGLSVEDVYHSSKIPFAFNYCDNDTDATHDNDEQGDHGTHVAGIAAANQIEGVGVVGVAPDAQVYVMKVFGKNGGAYDEDILAALEDALLLDSDVINMSLGSAAGFTSDGEEVDKIYDRVAETDTILTVSAGNSTTSGQGNMWGTDANTTLNPDNGVGGAPGTYTPSFTVASVENWKIESKYILAAEHKIVYTDHEEYTGTALSDLTG